MATSTRGQALYARLLDLVFPPRCPGCRARGFLVCPRCLDRCRSLRLDSDPEVGRAAPNTLLTTLRGAYQYDEPLRAAIHTFKYRRRRSMAGPLGELLLEALPEEAFRCDAIVAAPLHPSRMRERGFNQSALLAEAIAVLLDKPVLDALQRTRATDQQVGKDRREREANVRGAFAWRGAPPPTTVLLVDDVLTTGATMRECARALRGAGAREVHGLALASG